MSPAAGACMPTDVGSADDCNDRSSSSHPDLPEACNGLDDDCDGDVDESGAELCVAGEDHGMCMAGTCDFTCASGTADCDGEGSNGCESTLATDERHCGRCGQSCGVAGECVAGTCQPIVGVTLGLQHSCAWRASGAVLCWGSNGSGEVGQPTLTSYPGPVAVASVTDATSVCAGFGFTCARCRTGRVSCWGRGSQGERGGGVEPADWEPNDVPGVSDATAVACAYDRACALRSTGRVTCWGGGTSAQFGSSEMGPAPRDVPGLDAVASIEMFPFWYDLYATTTDGRSFTLGTTSLPGGGSHAAVSEVSHYFPSPVDRMRTSASRNSCAFLRSDGLFCWGSGDDWMDAGPGATTTPRAADPTLWSGVTEVAIAGGTTMCGVMSDGRVRCSGTCGSQGLRGDGCATMIEHGSYATGIDDAVHLVAHTDRMCAVRRRGDVVCWGSNVLGSGAFMSDVPLRIASD